MKTDDLIAELKKLCEMDLHQVLSAVQYHIEERTHFSDLMVNVNSSRDDRSKAFLITLK